MLKGYIEAIQNLFPINSPNYTINVSNITPKIKEDIFIPENIKKMKLEGKILTTPIYADVTITDKDGKVISSRKQMKIAEIPALIPITNSYLGSKGKEITILGQFRFKPGIYTTIPSSGDVKTTFHLKGTSFHLTSDAGKLYFTVDSKHFAIYPILRFFGITDDDIVNNFGNKFLENNKIDVSSAEIERLMKRFYKNVSRDQRSEDEIDTNDIITYFSGSIFDPNVNKVTLGQDFSQLNKETLLAAIKKFLNVSTGVEPPDSKDLLIFKRFHNVNDFIKERIEGLKWQLKRKIQRNLELHPDDIRRVLPTGLLSKPSFELLNSSVASMEKYTNPASILSAMTKMTYLGEGGLQTEYAATPEMRNFNFSMLSTLDPIQMPESEKIGLVFHAALGANVDNQGNITKIVFNHKTGKYETISGTDFWMKNIAFPDQYENGKFKNPNSVKVMNAGKIKYVKSKDVDYILPVSTSFSMLSSLIPMISSFHPTRALIASKMIGQALPLKNKEAPLVQSEIPSELLEIRKQLHPELTGALSDHLEHSNSFEELLGAKYSITSPVNGTVTSVSKNEIVVTDKKGEKYRFPLYNNFPVYPDSFIHQEPIVKVGDKVSKGMPLAKSNFTDGKALALGTNLLAAYIPFKGYNYEDAIVISESASKKLTSERIIHEYFEIQEGMILDKNKFRAIFPTLLLEENARKLDDDGVVKKGAIVKKGEILIAALMPRIITPDEYQLMRIHRKLVPKYRDASLIWNRDNDGEVIEVHKTKHAISLLIKTADPAEIGDKLVGRFGEKGLIAYIVPDSEMPRTKDGKVIDVVFNPLSVISRINTGQLVELALGKVAQKQGKPIYVPLFTKQNYVEYAKKLLKDHGLSDTETLIDPKTGKEIPNVMVGPKYIFKLEHEIKDKLDARYKGSYDMDLAPARQGEEGAKALDTYTAYGLFAHGALANLKEMATYKAEKNDAFWDAIENGFVLPAPKPTFAMDKFLAMLKSAGINVEKQGATFRLLPLTDKDVNEIAKIKIENPRTVSGAELKPEKGGLFDPALGGLTGTRWGYIQLAEPMPNPIVEKALLQILQLSPTQFEDLIAGKTVNGIQGVEGLKQYLKSLDIDKLITQYQEMAKNARLNELDKYNRIIRFLKGLKEAKIKPESLIITKVPVIPPKMRPIYIKDDQIIYSPFNDLYKHLLMANELLERTKELPEEHRGAIRLKAYEALKAIAGLTDPISPAFSKRPVQGILSMIAGPTPKLGYFQSKLARKEQDLVGRTAIIPEPDLHPDEVGLPYEIAWKIFEPFVIRKLIQQGYTKIQAIENVEDRTPIAKAALEAVAKERLVLLNRAPSLHKYNILAFKPRLIEGNAMKIPPLVVVGFNADFDGDEQLGFILISVKNDFKMQKWYLDLIRVGTRIMFDKNTKIPVKSDREYFIVNLADFPRLHLVASKNHIDFYAVPDDIEVLAYDEKTHTISWQKVTSWSLHHKRRVCFINLKSGKQIVSDDDPRAVYGIDPATLEYGRWRPVEGIGKLVPVVKNLKLQEYIKQISTKDCPYWKLKNCLKETIELNEEFGYLLGYIIGDGWISYINDEEKNVNIAINPKNLKLKKYLISIIKKFFKKKYNLISEQKIHKSKWQSSRIRINSKQLAWLISPWIGKNAENEHLPPFTLISPEGFRRGLLAGLIDSDGSISISHAKSKPQLLINLSTSSIRLAQEIQLLAKSLGIPASITAYNGGMKNSRNYMINFSNYHFQKANLNIKHPEKRRKLLSISVESSPSLISHDLVPFNSILAEIIMKQIDRDKEWSLYIIVQRHKNLNYITRSSALKILKIVDNDDPLFLRWRQIVLNDSITWDPVVSYEQTDIEEDGYDITVPGYETFMNIEGVVLSNTMTIHTPVTQEALEEAHRLLPSNNWLHEAKGTILLMPRHEAIIGIYRLTSEGRQLNITFNNEKEVEDAYKANKINFNDIVNVKGIGKTSFGRIIVNKVLPPELRDYKSQIDGSKLHDILMRIFRRDQKLGTDISHYFDKIGKEFAYLSGYSLSLNDITPIDLSDINRQIRETMPKLSSDKERQKFLSELADKVDKRVMSSKSRLVEAIKSRARGKVIDARQIIGAPIVATDINDNIIPAPVNTSYAAGMSFSDWFKSVFGGRKAAIDKVTSVSEPGMMTKELFSAMSSFRIVEHDCGTKNGVEMDLNEADALDYCLAENIYSHGRLIAKRNSPLTSDVVNALAAHKINKVKVRTPLTCESIDGVCQLCYGLDKFGQFPSIGDYVGIKAAQYIGEPMTQLILSRAHFGGTKGAPSLQGYKLFENILNFSPSIRPRATLAKLDGRVQKILINPDGSKDVLIDGVSHPVSRESVVTVKTGEIVKKGQQISEGIPHPVDVYTTRGMMEMRKYLSEQLRKIYYDNGLKVDKRMFDVLAKAMTNTGIITDPGDSDYVIGDKVPIDKIENKNKELKRPIKYTPVFRGLPHQVLLSTDWLNRISRKDIKNTLVEGTIRQWTGDISRYPIPAFAYGVELK